MGDHLGADGTPQPPSSALHVLTLSNHERAGRIGARQPRGIDIGVCREIAPEMCFVARRSASERRSVRGAVSFRRRVMPAKKATARKATPRASSRSATPVKRSSTRAAPARRGDLLVIDSTRVGSPAREGEILKVIAGEWRVSYQVRWADGHETLISPVAGTAHIVRR